MLGMIEERCTVPAQIEMLAHQGRQTEYPVQAGLVDWGGGFVPTSASTAVERVKADWISLDSCRVDDSRQDRPGRTGEP